MEIVRVIELNQAFQLSEKKAAFFSPLEIISAPSQPCYCGITSWIIPAISQFWEGFLIASSISPLIQDCFRPYLQQFRCLI